MFSSVRVRLTLWYVLVFGILLSAFSLALYLALSRDLYARLDSSLIDSSRIIANSFANETSEREGDAVAGASDTLSTLHLPGVLVAIYQGDRLLGSNYPEPQPAAAKNSSLRAARQDGEVTLDTIGGLRKRGYRQVLLSVRGADGDFDIFVSQPLRDVAGQLGSIRRFFYVGLTVALLAAGIGGFALARKSLAPVVAMSDQAEHISARNLHERLVVVNKQDELGHLASVFNELLSRLDRSFGGMREFMADASHELRTPLSIIRGEADVALSQERDSAEYKAALTVILDETRRLSRLLDDMLELARADAGQRPLVFDELYLNDLVDECCKSAQVLAAQKGVGLTSHPAADIPYAGDEDILRRMLLNLLDNAIKYTPSGGQVAVRIQQDTDAVRVVVSDTGIGISTEAAAHIFERFYRINEARSRAGGGSGLGLPIAKWAAEVHKGSITLSSRAGEGSTFTVILPSVTRTEQITGSV